MISKHIDGLDGIVTMLNGLTSDLQKIAIAIAGIAVVALAIVLIGGGGQGLQKAKPMAISICVGVIVAALGVTIVSGIYGSMGG